MPLSKKTTPGATVIELLAAALVLVILIALLLPITTAVTHRNNAIRCMGNLRHMHSGMIAYINDHNGSVPPYREFWPQENGAPLRGDFWTAKIKPYLAQDRAQKYNQCPAEKVLPDNHYGMSTSISADGVLHPEKLADTQLPGKRYLFADASQKPRITTTAFPTEAAFRHHERRINLVYFDGHVESHTLEELPLPANGFKQTDAEYKAFFKGTR
ncbi:MAG TPA: hypothetical protein VNQ90_05560 [Chthoniobacteraceae bacterium]|nr:hypothetical protein [Chthoniobacteraceae bacterium]